MFMEYLFFVLYLRSQLVHDYNLNAMERVGNVGVGGFGLVILVRYSSEGEKPYSTNQSENEGDKELLALKLLNKKQIVAGEQQEAVVREVEILTALRDCNLALHLLGTMQDQANLYLLTEYVCAMVMQIVERRASFLVTGRCCAAFRT